MYQQSLFHVVTPVEIRQVISGSARIIGHSWSECSQKLRTKLSIDRYTFDTPHLEGHLDNVFLARLRRGGVCAGYIRLEYYMNGRGVTLFVSQDRSGVV